MPNNFTIINYTMIYSVTSFPKPVSYIWQRTGAAAYCNAVLTHIRLYHGYCWRNRYILMSIRPDEWKRRKVVKS